MAPTMCTNSTLPAAQPPPQPSAGTLKYGAPDAGLTGAHSPEIEPVLAMLALGIFGSGFAYLWNFKVMEVAGSAIASSVTYLTPVIAIIVGVIFLNEKITWNEPVGALIVLLGAAIAQERLKLKR